jgi:uncharacterized protein YbjT (DUF2867 family)
MITVMGASGHTGGKIASALLAAGERVRVIGRSESRLASLRQAGAEVRIGDAADAQFLTRAFEGADAVYTLVSPAPSSPDYRAAQDQAGEAIVAAVRASGVRRVVALISLGADSVNPAGLIAGLAAQEKRLQQLKGTDVVLLRPASFFENFEGALGLIKEHGICGDSVRPDLAIPMVATRDIANIAVDALRARDGSGVVVREIIGPRDLSYAEATRLLGQQIGLPGLKYDQFPDEDMRNALVQAGMSASFARLYVEMTQAINEQKLQPREGRNFSNTTSTDFETYAAELANAYRAM